MVLSYVGLLSLLYIKADDINRLADVVVPIYLVLVVYIIVSGKLSGIGNVNDTKRTRSYESKRKSKQSDTEASSINWKEQFDGDSTSIVLATFCY